MDIKFHISLIFLCLLSVVRSQDLIVNTDGDSLNCKIKKVKPDYIYYEFNSGNGILESVLSVTQIKMYEKGFYKKAPHNTPDAAAKQITKKDVSGFRLGIYGGWSYLLGKVDKSLPAFLYNYNKELKSGYHVSANAGYFFKSGVGVGIKYSRFTSTNKYDGKIYIIDSLTKQKKVGDMMDNITIQYFAPTYMARSVFKNGLEFSVDFSLGYLAYRDIATVVDDFVATSGTLGTSIYLGLSYPVVKNFYAGINCSLVRGTLYYYKYDDGSRVTLSVKGPNKPNNISRIDLSAGLMWYF